MVIFHCYVSLPEGMSQLVQQTRLRQACGVPHDFEVQLHPGMGLGPWQNPGSTAHSDFHSFTLWLCQNSY